MLSRTRPRIRRAIRFFYLSFGLFLLALFGWLFNKILDAVPSVSQELSITYLEWVGYVFLYIITVGFFLWAFSKLNTGAWEIIAGMLSWKDKDDPPKGSPTGSSSPDVSDKTRELKTATANSDKPLDQEEADALSDVLSFYGTEVTSHAGLSIGFVVASLALLQVRFGSGFAISLRPLLWGLLIVVLTGAVFAMLKVALYGTLSSIIMHSSYPAYRNAIRAHSDSGAWTALTKATMFSEFHLLNDTLKKNRFRWIAILPNWRWRITVSVAVASIFVCFLTTLGV